MNTTTNDTVEPNEKSNSVGWINLVIQKEQNAEGYVTRNVFSQTQNEW